MRPRRLLLLLAVLLCFVAARRRAVPTPEREPIPDVFSASNPTHVKSTHLSLDLTVDFNAQILRGSVTHTLVNLDGADQFIVDTNGLLIDAVTANGKSAPWSYGTSAANGQPMIIAIDPKTTSVRIDYHTMPTATGLHWLKAQETRSRVQPALWSENEPYMARSWIPLQDTPSVRVTYDATIHAPAGELALMSAANNPTTPRNDGVYAFSMPHSIPSYLIALTVAKYEFRDMGNRTGVYAEPSLIADTVYETQFLPDMLSAAERLIGPYTFERYDLVFPPKYPGGMENPELNFIAQDMITGNHPAVVPPHTLVAHELAHSWFGDLLTCAEWNDLWLNEGFATYYASRIDDEMGQTEFAKYILETDRSALDDYLALKPPARITVLHRTFIGNERPAFTIIWYQKGEAFLKTLEDLMGRTAFDAFIARYERSHEYHWVDDLSLRATLLDDPNDQSGLLVDDWIYGSFLPSNVSPKPSSAYLARVTAQANAFRAGTKASDLDVTGWTEFEWGQFLLQIQDVIVPRMSELDSAFGFSKMNTPPQSWLTAAASSLDAPSKALLDRYLAIGKVDSVNTWYTLSRSAAGRTYGVPLYNNVRNFYDANTRILITSYFSALP
jgi:leukotriene-A4 hydrolase